MGEKFSKEGHNRMEIEQEGKELPIKLIKR